MEDYVFHGLARIVRLDRASALKRPIRRITVTLIFFSVNALRKLRFESLEF